ncbi:hypothetical protein P280DRAFT_516335 [Massarina eburnea CBS 473.64]|uniref:F-box domain-containing protein n=1 Tax=Massarina eburnea CBS 473.64 TaxID=1395130 RepID=A0A6A6S4L8_9PLEO|nr:hypothetical protein P280DRAFT_516335 [Massarina eburnea CBS 473.64]
MAVLKPLLASERNCHSNVLCRLPDELVLEIASHLDDPGLLALRITSQTFLSIFEAVPTEWAPDRLNRAREDLWFIERVLLEKSHSNMHTLQKLLCSRCRILHPRGNFHPNEHFVDPIERLCIRYTGKFRACEHEVSYTFDEMVALKPISVITCDHCNMPDYRFCEAVALLIPGIRVAKWPYGFELLRIKKMRLPAPLTRLTYGQIRHALIKENMYICPHLRTSTDSLFRIVCAADAEAAKANAKDSEITTEVPRRIFNRSWEIFRGSRLKALFSDKVDMSSMFLNSEVTCRCPWEHCQTDFAMWYDEWMGAGHFKTWRYLGEFNSPFDEKWVAQLEA